jgi:hypothetical protein
MATQYIEDPKTKEQIPFEWDKETPPTPNDINALLIAARGTSTPAKEPSLIDSLTPSKQTIANIARPALEYGGMLGGGVLGLPAGPAGAIAGAGLGYAGGRQAANIADQLLIGKRPQDPLTEIANAGKDFAGGATMEMGGGIAGNLLQRGGQAIADSGLPKWLYSKAMKTPLSAEWKATIPTKEYTKREMVIQKGMEGNIKPNELGKAKVINRIDEIQQDVSDIVANLKKQGGADTSVHDIANAVDPLMGNANMSREGVGNVNALNTLRNEVIRKGGSQFKLDPVQLQTLKQQFYKDVKWDFTKQVLKDNGRFTEDGTKAIAKKAMERLEELAPELAYLNKKESYYIDLQKAIEHTIARYENTNAVGIGAKMLVLRNIGMGALEAVSGTPTVKATLALALKKAGKVAPATIGRPAFLAGMRDNPNQQLSPEGVPTNF